VVNVLGALLVRQGFREVKQQNNLAIINSKQQLVIRKVFLFDQCIYFLIFSNRMLTQWNRISLWLGILISIGLSLIGNFQLENSNKIPKYIPGNYLLFIFD